MPKSRWTSNSSLAPARPERRPTDSGNNGDDTFAARRRALRSQMEAFLGLSTSGSTETQSHQNHAPPPPTSTSGFHTLDDIYDGDSSCYQDQFYPAASQPGTNQSFVLPSPVLDTPGFRALFDLTDSPTSQTQAFVIADHHGDSLVSEPTENDFIKYQFRKWAVVTVLLATFSDCSHYVSSCSLCKVSDEWHSFFHDARDFVRPEINCPSDLLAPCTHCRLALAHIVRKLDKPLWFQSWSALHSMLIHHLVQPSDISQCFPRRFHDVHGLTLDAFSTEDRQDIAFARTADKTYCPRCERWMLSKRSCAHVRDIPHTDFELLGDTSLALDDERDSGADTDSGDDDDDDEDGLVFSKSKYPFDFASDHYLASEIAARRDGYQPWLSTRFRGNTVDPEPPSCSCPRTADVFKTHTSDGVLFGPTFTTNLTIRSRTCKCGTAFFDGRDVGIINYNNQYLFPVELLREYLMSYSRSGEAVYSWWRNKVSEQRIVLAASRSPRLFLDRCESWNNLSSQISTVITEFSLLLDIPRQLFQCCDAPRAIAVDGIVLSVKSSELEHLEQPWVWTSAPRTAVSRATRIPDRSLVILPTEEAVLNALLSGTATRQALHAALADSPGPGPALVFHLALARARPCNLPPMTDAPNDLIPLPASIKQFVLCMLRDVSPATQLLPRAVWPIVDSSFPPVERNQPPRVVTSAELLAKLASWSPFVRDALVCARDVQDRAVRADCLLAMHTFIRHIRAICDRVCNQADLGNRFRHEGVTFQTPVEELLKTGVYAPCHPIKRRVPHVPLTTREDCESCTKHAKGRTHLGPGVVLFWCVEHRHCIGWSVMTRAESPRTVYEFLASRFTTMPPIFIYDNACNLSEYAQNRNPALFADTFFLCDGFHFPSHTNCAPTFDAARYKGLYTGSSVVHEQKNRDLARLKHTSPKMGYRTFVSRLMFAVARLNEDQAASRVRQTLPRPRKRKR